MSVGLLGALIMEQVLRREQKKKQPMPNCALTFGICFDDVLEPMLLVLLHRHALDLGDNGHIGHISLNELGLALCFSTSTSTTAASSGGESGSVCADCDGVVNKGQEFISRRKQFAYRAPVVGGETVVPVWPHDTHHGTSTTSGVLVDG